MSLGLQIFAMEEKKQKQRRRRRTVDLLSRSCTDFRGPAAKTHSPLTSHLCLGCNCPQGVVWGWGVIESLCWMSVDLEVGRSHLPLALRACNNLSMVFRRIKKQTKKH